MTHFPRPRWQRWTSALGLLTAALMLLGLWPTAAQWLPPLPTPRPAHSHHRALSTGTWPSVTPLAPAKATSPPRAGGRPRPRPTAPGTSVPGVRFTHGQTYTTQAGDTLPVLAVRFGVPAATLQALDGRPLPPQGLLSPGLTLWVPPDAVRGQTPATRLLPDSEIPFSPSAVDFDTRDFLERASSPLLAYREYLPTPGTLDGAALVDYIAHNYSINPRLLLAVLEYRGGWVFSRPDEATRQNPLHRPNNEDHGRLSKALVWIAEQLATGYYGWREGRLTRITFATGEQARLAPTLNAGTVALMYLFAQLLPPAQWEHALDPSDAQGFPAFYATTFGDPWERARWAEPLYPPDLRQPRFILPFPQGQTWSLTSGPHGAYGPVGSLAALDLAPAHEGGPRCRVSRYWVLAVADGVVVRLEPGIVVLDLDGDGHEQTGWNVLYLHIATEGRQVKVGDQVHQGDPLGHPSCEGGVSTGTHVHLARKYNGEWMAAAGPIPFEMEGWVAQAGDEPYEGRLVRGEQVVVANPLGIPASLIRREAP